MYDHEMDELCDELVAINQLLFEAMYTLPHNSLACQWLIDNTASLDIDHRDDTQEHLVERAENHQKSLRDARGKLEIIRTRLKDAIPRQEYKVLGKIECSVDCEIFIKGYSEGNVREILEQATFEVENMCGHDSTVDVHCTDVGNVRIVEVDVVENEN